MELGSNITPAIQAVMDAVAAHGFKGINLERDWLMTPTMYQHFCENPQEMGDELHERYCAGGMIDVQYADGQEFVKHCPRCERERNLRVLAAVMKRSGITEDYLEHTWESIELDIGLESGKKSQFRRGMNYANRIHEMREKGISLIIHGLRVGIGKTLLSVMIAKDAIYAGYSARVTSLALECVKIRENYGKRSNNPDALTESILIEQMAKPDFLFLDDLGAEHISEHKIEARVLGHVLDARHMAGKPTIISSNRPPHELEMGNDYPKGTPQAFQGYGTRTMNRLEPFEELYINHNKNFRVEKGEAAKVRAGIRSVSILEAA